MLVADHGGLPRRTRRAWCTATSSRRTSSFDRRPGRAGAEAHRLRHLQDHRRCDRGDAHTGARCGRRCTCRPSSCAPRRRWARRRVGRRRGLFELLAGRASVRGGEQRGSGRADPDYRRAVGALAGARGARGRRRGRGARARAGREHGLSRPCAPCSRRCSPVRRSRTVTNRSVVVLAIIDGELGSARARRRQTGAPAVRGGPAALLLAAARRRGRCGIAARAGPLLRLIASDGGTHTRRAVAGRRRAVAVAIAGPRRAVAGRRRAVAGRRRAVAGRRAVADRRRAAAGRRGHPAAAPSTAAFPLRSSSVAVGAVGDDPAPAGWSVIRSSPGHRQGRPAVPARTSRPSRTAATSRHPASELSREASRLDPAPSPSPARPNETPPAKWAPMLDL